MTDQANTPGPGGEDDFARQRCKRQARLFGRPVLGFTALTIADAMEEVMAAAEESGGPLDVVGLLADRDWLLAPSGSIRPTMPSP